MEKSFEKFDFKKRLNSMLKVDFRRMFTMPFLYIVIGITLVVPILIFVMTSMMEGTVTVDPTTGKETIMTGFESVWQALGALPSSEATLNLDLVSMCNINLIFFAIAIVVCIFVSADFKSGYAKNLFTMRASKIEYVISKTLTFFVSGTIMILAYFIGSLIGGAIAGLNFQLVGFTLTNVIMCLLAKIFLLLVFTAIYLVMSVIGKHKTWLSMVLSLVVSMLLFMMIPSISPLTSTIINVALSLASGVIFCTGIGAISNAILKKTSLV